MKLPRCTLLLLAPLTLALAPVSATPEGVPIALGSAGGGYTLWSIPAPGAEPVASLTDVRFLPLELVGYAPIERLRLDRPAEARASAGPERIRLPQGGSLYRVSVGPATGILHVRPDGGFTFEGATADVAGQPGLLPQVHVSSSGARALVAAPAAAGGAVLLLDLLGTSPAVTLTSSDQTLAVEGDSLRVGDSSAWFVAGGRLYRTPDLEGGNAAPVGLDLAPDEVVLPELALASAAETVVAVVEATPDARRLVYVSQLDPYVAVTSGSGDYATPGYGDPLGPLLAVSPDGGMVAFRSTTDVDQLFVRRAAPDAVPFQVTAPPHFLTGIDNIGVIGLAKVALVSFLDADHLAFVTGDFEQDDEEVELESGEMFVANLADPSALFVHNVTQSSGESMAPYSGGDLEFREIVFDPLGQRLVFHGKAAGAESALLSFRVDTVLLSPPSKVSPVPTMEVLLEDLEEEVRFVAAERRLLVLATEESEADDGSETSERLYVLQPAEEELPASLDPLGSFEEDTVLARFATAADGELCAFVARDEDQVEGLFVAHLSHASLELVALPFPSYSSALAFSPIGRLYLGFGFSTAEQRFASLDARWGGARGGLGLTTIDLPAGEGFPLVP